MLLVPRGCLVALCLILLALPSGPPAGAEVESARVDHDGERLPPPSPYPLPLGGGEGEKGKPSPPAGGEGGGRGALQGLGRVRWRDDAAVKAVAFSPDGKLLASGGEDRAVCVWEVKTGKLLRRFEGHKEEVWRVAFLADGKTLASAEWCANGRLWDVRGRAPVAELFARPDRLRALALLPDGKSMAVMAGEALNLLRRADQEWERLESADRPILALSCDSSGRLAALRRDGVVDLW